MFLETISKILKQFNISLKTSWKNIPKKVKNLILYGDDNSTIIGLNKFEGITNFIDRKYKQTKRFWVRYELEKYLSERDCEVCNGYRLNEKALAVKINNLHIGEITKKSITECLNWFNKLKSKLNQSEIQIAEGDRKSVV